MGYTRSWGRGRLRSRWLAAGALGGIVLVAAACSSGATSSTTTTKAPSSSAGTPGRATVAVAKVGSLGTVLVNGSGMTLYHFSHDATGRSTCTGGCVSLWPPVTVPAGTKPVAGQGLAAAQLGTISRSDGTTQVTYRGMPLYTYTGDKQAGQATGQDVAGAWFVVGSTSAAAPPTSGGGTTTTSGGGSGGYGY